MNRFSVVAGLLGLALVAAVPAAADGPRVDAVRASADGSVGFTFSDPALPASAGLDPQAVTVTFGNQVVPSSAVAVRTRQAAAATVQAMLVVDTSGSMQGSGLAGARGAIQAFVRAAPSDVAVGLTTFSTAAHLVAAPSLDRARLLGALPGLSAHGETALFDALLSAAEQLRGPGPKRLVVVSDGGDTVSRTPLAKVLTSLQSAHVAVEVAGLRTREADNATLRTIAAVTGGRFVAAANGADLASALQSSARAYATALTVHAKWPGHGSGQQRFVVTVDSSAGRLSASAVATFPALPVAARRTSAHGTAEPRQLLVAGLAAIALSLGLGFLALFSAAPLHKRRMRRLVARYTTRGAQPGESLAEVSPVARTALGLAERLAATHGVQERLTRRLERAAVNLAPSEWLLLQAGLALVTVMVFALLGMALPLAVVAGLAGGPGAGHAFLSVRASRRRAAFAAMLPDTLQLLAGSLSAGYSLPQAMDGVVREGSQPMAAEIGRALAESRLGVPVENTLFALAERMQSENFQWVVLAIQIQHQVGGNLSAVLLTVAQTMRERVQLRRHVRALSAEGRLSAYILLGLPVFLTLYLLMVRRDYIRLLYTTKLGLVMIGFAVVMMTIGAFVMKKMATVTV